MGSPAWLKDDSDDDADSSGRTFRSSDFCLRAVRRDRVICRSKLSLSSRSLNARR